MNKNIKFNEEWIEAKHAFLNWNRRWGPDSKFLLKKKYMQETVHRGKQQGEGYTRREPKKAHTKK